MSAEKTFQSLERSHFLWPQCSSTCRMRNILFEEQMNSFFFEVWSRGLYFWREKKFNQVVTGDVYCLRCPNEKCVFLSIKKTSSFYDCRKCKARSHVLNIPLKDQKPTIMLFGRDSTEKNESWLGKRKTNSIFEEIFQPITTKHNRTSTKKHKNHSVQSIIVLNPHWLVQISKKTFSIRFLNSFSDQ